MKCPKCKKDVDMLKFTTTGTMCRDCHKTERTGTVAVAGAVSGSEAAWMCYYFDAEKQKNMVITAVPMTKHQDQAHARAANKYYAGRHIVQVCPVPQNDKISNAGTQKD